MFYVINRINKNNPKEFLLSKGYSNKNETPLGMSNNSANHHSKNNQGGNPDFMYTADLVNQGKNKSDRIQGGKGGNNSNAGGGNNNEANL